MLIESAQSPKSSNSQSLFITWVPFQRRTVSMQSFFEYEVCTFGFSFRNRLFRLVEYLFKCCQTLVLLIQRQPQIVWVQLPPSLPLHIACLFKALFSPNLTIVVDGHNATFRKPWLDFLGTRKLLYRCDTIIVHNDWVQQQAIALGFSPEAIVVLEDPPAKIDQCPSTSARFPHPWVIFPCSFNADEPIEAVLEAARQAPDLTFVLTGKTERAKGIHDLSKVPSNVVLTGFLDAEVFDQLLCETDAVLGFTKFEGIQLSVANEAVGVGKPLVLSQTNTLKQLFYKGAVYVDSNSAEAIAVGCLRAIEQANQLQQDICELRQEREAAWIANATRIKHQLVGSSTSR